ncbi:sporulation integral membrane protein YtvI [Anaerocolumna xylanovorans]|uniref:Sporulation integral membrane protein YtvI n=1 Tax=Anaerocolumna xylanovorans DSM 12503 TaxID=1121345 RepID=A0A1M7YD14_9FIRM|nr:sporulation integral membrane protein YtvI [Anaerocolumna xylanovorans]SHO50515.1 sporulation integral membrane protein YtvI [Anaerocolumna xylanovorans DSM 12503]
MKKILVYIKILVNMLLFILGVLAVIFLVPKLLRFFMPFVIGFIVSVIANPLVKFLEKRVKILRKHSSAIIIVLVIGAVVGVMYALISVLINEFSNLIRDFPNIYKSMETQFQTISLKLSSIYDKLPVGITVKLDEVGNNITEYASKIVADSSNFDISDAGYYAKNLMDIILYAIVTIMSAYFFIAERDNLAATVHRMTPAPLLKSYNLIVSNFKAAVGGYFKAQFKIMLVLTVILFVGLEIIDVKYSFLFALLIAFLDFLPFFGTGAVMWPWALVEILTGNYFKSAMLIIVYLVCTIVKQVLQPKMVGDSIGISPFSTLVFMFIGYRLLGVLGIIIGIPIGMVLVNFYKAGMFDGVIKGFKIIIHDINEFRKL